ncbi:YfhO family protein [Lentilactobacillus kosonis]|uniref:Integral membrane protein n=1 Tax=Lentilactobacillus kosonis TaxID=2810561 RepID=A0A401FMV3_9LACO|nr:integral membrane protein [Lentilactobacillus kosonis]
MESLGFSTRNIRRIDMLGGTEVTNHLLGIRNIVAIGNNQITANHDMKAAPIGFMVNDDIQNLTFEKNMVFKNLNRVVQIEAGNEYQYFKAPKLVSLNSIDKDGVHNYKLILKAQTSGSQYLYIPKIRLSGVSISVNGQMIPPIYSGLGTEVIPLGNIRAGHKFSVQITSPNSLTGVENDFAGLDNQAFNRDVVNRPISTLKFDKPKEINYQGDNFKGNINVTQNNQTLFMSMPFDMGWHIEVNGKPGKVIKVADGLMGIKLHPGNNRLHFKYEAAGLKLGIVLSIATLVLVVITELVRVRRHKM